MSNNKETQEPLMGQPVELEVVGATEATQAAGEASVRPQREEPLKGRKAVRKPAGKEGEAAGETVEAQGAAHEDAATEQPSEEAEAERVAEAIRQAIEEQAREDENPHSTNYTLRQIIGGEMLQTGVMRKNVGLMAVVGLFLFVSVVPCGRCAMSLRSSASLTASPATMPEKCSVTASPRRCALTAASCASVLSPSRPTSCPRPPNAPAKSGVRGPRTAPMRALTARSSTMSMMPGSVCIC